MSLFLRAARVDPKTPRDTFPFTVPALKNFECIEFDSPVTFFIGENGSGKSTLLEALAVKSGLNAEGGGKNFHFSTTNTTSELHKALVLEREPGIVKNNYFFRAESFYTLANEIERIAKIGAEMYDYYGSKSLHLRSHGEAFLTVVRNRLSANGLYLFDEPEAALSPSRQLTVMSIIHQLVAENSQFIIATHSPILLAYPNARIYEFTESGIVPTTYEATEQYQITHDFLINPARMLHTLFEDDGSQN
jgi:predicted ATPase